MPAAWSAKLAHSKPVNSPTSCVSRDLTSTPPDELLDVRVERVMVNVSGMLTNADINIRDPFIVPAREEKRYYLYGTTGADTWEGKPAGFDLYTGDDLEHWEGRFQPSGPCLVSGPTATTGRRRCIAMLAAVSCLPASKLRASAVALRSWLPTR